MNIRRTRSSASKTLNPKALVDPSQKAEEKRLPDGSTPLFCAAQQGKARCFYGSLEVEGSARCRIRLMIQILSLTFKTLNFGNSGIFLIMGNAGFIGLRVKGLGLRLRVGGLGVEGWGFRS